MESAGMSVQKPYEILGNTPFSSTFHLNAVTSAPLTTELLSNQLHSSISADLSSSLLFVDAGVSNYQSLIAGVQPGTEVHILDSTQDAIAQITQTLMGRSNISSLHILSHGSVGGVQLGADWVGVSSLDQHANQLQSWASALTDDADILLYGCDVAEGEVGQTFVKQLARLTGADVAASDDLTGNSALGGDWDLEVKTGEVTAPLAFGQVAMSKYAQTLGIIINEFQRATGTGNTFSNAEYIEFLLTTDYTATDLQSLFFGDSNSSTSQKSGIYRFQNLSSIASTFKAGTIIVAGGSTVVPTEDISYNPIASGTDDQWNISLKFGGSYITGSGGDFSGSQDAAWVDNSGAGTLTSIHSIAYTTNGTYGLFGSAATIKLNGLTTNNVVTFNGDGTQTTDSTKFSFVVSGSLGLANGGDNTTYINSLRNPNSPPTAQASSVTFNEDSIYSFQASDFGFFTTNGGTLQSVQITQLPTIGQLFLDTDGNNTQDAGEAISANQTLILTDIPKLKFKPVADANGPNYANFKFKVSDGQTLSASDAAMTLNVTPVNDAPMLDVSGNPTLSSIYVGNTNSTGTRISDLISSLGGSKITDIDNAVSAIALTSVDNTNGTWQFSTDSGSTWQDVGTVSDSAARVLGATSLYTAGLNTLPSSQSWLSYTNLKLSGSIPVPGNATQTLGTGGTTVNTSADINNYAGYSNYNTSQQLVNANFPTLDRAQGFGVAFNLQVLSDSHTNNDRAAFSVILLGSDKRGIELAFQDGKIFAQNDDSAGGQLFTAGENAVFDTKLLTSYRVAVKDDTYQLFAGNTLILTGAVRDYRNWQPPSNFPSPYLLSNFVFLGDNTTSAQGSFYLTQVALQTDTRLRFVPNTNYTGSAQIGFRAWDATNGSSNGQANVSASFNGGAAAFSTATETAAITVKPLPTLSINNVSQIEGNSGTKTYTFTISLSEVSSETVTVNYATIDGSATVADGDYQAASGTLTFNGGEVSKTIEIQVNGDTKFELDETFLIKLSNASNAKITSGADIGVGTIVDDDKSGWTIAKTADFDNDGKVDILWRNISTGGTAIWKMNGTTFDTSTPLPVADTNWRIEGVADFDKNGYLDLLWRNISTGTTAIWKMNGFTVTGSVALPTAAKEWRIEGVADFDKDGFVDILWRNINTGGNAIWKMNGTSVATSIALSTTDLHWQVQAVADFDNDGFVDILWHNTATGGNAFWRMNGMSVNTSVALPATLLEWQIAGVADFDNDGRADILWRNTSTGGMAIWKMNGTSAPTSTALSFADLDWQVEDLSDLDGDDFVDIVWRNYSTGGNALWKMSGTTVTTSIALRPA